MAKEREKRERESERASGGGEMPLKRGNYSELVGANATKTRLFRAKTRFSAQHFFFWLVTRTCNKNFFSKRHPPETPQRPPMTRGPVSCVAFQKKKLSLAKFYVRDGKEV